MSSQWGHGFYKGAVEGVKSGQENGETVGKYMLANQMRVLLCALIAAHKKEDHSAFWSTVEIAKATLNQSANFTDDEWAIFRNDKSKEQA